jgi:hypothetical protein
LEEIIMALRYLGIDPNTDGEHCPTAWLDEATGDYVLQGWRVTDTRTMAEIGEVPADETVIRFPKRMTRFLLEAGGTGAP